MAKPIRQSAGILLYRWQQDQLQVLLVHPGGPVWMNKDEGAWTIPKGEFTDDELPLHAAIREFEEELGQKIEGDFKELRPIVQKGGKKVYAWALQGDFNLANLKSNPFSMEWPPKSGNWRSYPEVDKADWFDLATAVKKINPAQIDLIKELTEKLQQA